MDKYEIKERLGCNLRILRDRQGLTQKDLAAIIATDSSPQRVGATSRNIGSYEEGRAFPQPDMMLNILEYFKLDYQTLIGKDFRKFSEAELSSVLHPRPAQLQILAVPVGPNGREKIAMVGEKAAAGYIKGFADREYIQELDSFHLPWLPTGATYRAFEISGDSMPPIQPGSVVLGKFIEKDDLKFGDRYVVITKEGIVFKRIYKSPTESSRHSLLLTSDNPVFAPYELHLQEVLEVWQFYAHIDMGQHK